MSYTKQTFVNNQTVLTAEMMDHIEAGIVENENKISQLSEEKATIADFFDAVEIPSINRLDESQLVDGIVVNGQIHEQDGYRTTGYIPVSEGEYITFQVGDVNLDKTQQVALFAYISGYDSNKNFVAGSYESWVDGYTVPANVSFVRFSSATFVQKTPEQQHRMLVVGNELLTYVPYGSETKYVLKAENNNDDHIKETVKSDDELFEKVETLSMNRLNMDEVEYGVYINPGNGVVSANSQYATTGYIPVSEGEIITFQVGGTDNLGMDQILNMIFLVGFDADKKPISTAGGRNVKEYLVPSGVRYIRMSSTHFVSDGNAYRVVVASTELVDYEPYGVTVETILRPELYNDDHIKAVSGITVDAYLPKNIYCAVGRTIELYNNQVCLQADKYHMRWNCRVGKALKRKFSVTGADGLIGDYTLSLEVYDDRKNLVWDGKTTLHIVSDAITTAHSICPIGDSLTNIKYWLPEVVNLADGNISFVGTYPCGLDDASGNRRNCGHEGRSGFTAKNYVNGDAYTYGGATETPNNIFWNGSRFSWTQYKTTSGSNPDAVQIFLGTNGIAEDNTENAGYIKQMVDYIRQDDATIPIFVVNTIYRGTQDGIGVQQSNDGYASQVGVWKYNEDKKVMDLMIKLDKLLNGYSNVHMVNLALSHDSEYNFGAVETAVNPRATQTELMPVESVHPQKQGYFQMADVMFSVMCSVWGA